jgi:hypothetical protein
MTDEITTKRQLQVVYRETTEFIESPAHIPWDDTIPHHHEGVEVLNVTVKPTPGINLSYLLVEAIVQTVEKSNTADQVVVALFRNDEHAAIAASCGEVYGPRDDFGGTPSAIPFRYMLKTGGTDPIRLSIRAGVNNGNININGAVGERKLGGVLVSSITVTELA